MPRNPSRTESNIDNSAFVRKHMSRFDVTWSSAETWLPTHARCFWTPINFAIPWSEGNLTFLVIGHHIPHSAFSEACQRHFTERHSKRFTIRGIKGLFSSISVSHLKNAFPTTPSPEVFNSNLPFQLSIWQSKCLLEILSRDSSDPSSIASSKQLVPSSADFTPRKIKHCLFIESSKGKMFFLVEISFFVSTTTVALLRQRTDGWQRSRQQVGKVLCFISLGKGEKS